MVRAWLGDFLDPNGPTRFAIPNATTAPVTGWSVEFSRGQGFWNFELVATDAPDLRVHGVVTDGSELTLACVHDGERSRVVALEPPPSPPDLVDDEFDFVDWLAGVLAHAVDAPDDDLPPSPPPNVSLLPVGDAWDAQFVVPSTGGEIYPKEGWSRSYLAEGAAALAAREPGDRVDFWFAVPSYEDPDGSDPLSAWGPWLFDAWPDGPEARIRLGFFGGAMGPDETFGWTAWTDELVWFAAYDNSTGTRAIVKASKPAELRDRGPEDPAWWLALARLLTVLNPFAVGEFYGGEALYRG